MPGNIVSQKSRSVKRSVVAFQYIMEPRFPQEPAGQACFQPAASGRLTYSLSKTIG